MIIINIQHIFEIYEENKFYKLKMRSNDFIYLFLANFLII